MRWARLSVTFEEIAADNPELVHDLAKYNPTTTVPFLAGLLTLPIYQSHCIRLETLVGLAVVHCHGRKTPSVRHAQRWFEQLGHSKCVVAEDPAEDVFVSLVHDGNGDYRLFEGAWESAAFYTQRLLDVIARMSPNDHIQQMQRTVRALLTVSDLVCAKAGLSRYHLGSDALPGAMLFHNLPGRNTLISQVTIPFDDLRRRGAAGTDLAPFFLVPQMATELPAQEFGRTNLDYHPLIRNDDRTLVLALPSALSIALRNYIISTIAGAGLLDDFDNMLATEYESLLADTPVFGGPLDVPIRWQKVGKHRVSAACFAADMGHYISMHLFLPSVHIHKSGGFKADYRVEDALTHGIQRSVDAVRSRLAGQSDFRRGLAVIVGCGWGKGYSSRMPDVDDDRWRVQDMSVADLVLLSRMDSMTPQYFWRIAKGLDVITKAGVHIQNINGILNLIAWVRSNRGHFVPHEKLPDMSVSPEQPLLLNPPLNLLRELRAEVVQGYDGHCSRDYAGNLHYVERESLSPFFDSASRRRLYVSKDDVRTGQLTTVYEGKRALWISVFTPNVVSRELTYRLWQMVCEWLHRIGDILDKRHHDSTEAPIVEVHVEFRDGDPPGTPVTKPTTEELERRCVVVQSGDSGARRAIFEVGFLAGFRIRENVAEQLVVRTLVRAFLLGMSVDDVDGGTDAVVSEVVPNREARQFHLFHAQNFTDYVSDALPKDLVTIDAIDEAAIRVGMGVRASGAEDYSPIVGRDACTTFMNGVVDSLLDGIIAELQGFNRLAMLRRLVGNCLKAIAERDHWLRTSAAVMGLHGGAAETGDRFVEHMSTFAGATTTCRVLTEIALCVCPLEGGMVCSDIDISRLMARAALVCRIGGLSDAIYYSALPPAIRVSSLGDILVADDFGRFVVEPTLSDMVRGQVAAEASRQGKNYDAPVVGGEVRVQVGEEFWNTWKVEMGFDLDQAGQFVGVAESRGIKEGATILEVARSEYLDSVCSVGVERKAAENFMDRFCLSTREDWRRPPQGFAVRDLYPWRFGRKLSFVARPILQVNDKEDPLLAIAPAALRTGVAYVVWGAHSGRLDRSFFRTRRMRNEWLGKAREGHSFNHTVAERFAEAGWQVRENVGLPEILGRAIAGDAGDVDVLAWSADRRRVLVIECKDLAPARSYSEVAALLSDYQGGTVGGKLDKLGRHLRRVRMIRDDVERVEQFIGIARPEVVSCLVCSGVVPMQYAKIEALADTAVGTVEKVLTSV